MRTLLFLLVLALLGAGSPAAAPPAFSLAQASRALPQLAGQPQNTKFLYVTAGDQLYAIGDQGGNFPEIGFHVPGEMGGVWQHPIKLLDGYRMELRAGAGPRQLLAGSTAFTAYSFLDANTYRLPAQHLEVMRTQFVPDGLPVLVVEYSIRNTGPTDQQLGLRLLADVDLRPVWLAETQGVTDGSDALLPAAGPAGTLFKDELNPWFVALTADHALRLEKTGPSPFKGKGLTGTFASLLRVARGGTATIRYFVGGSTGSAQEALANIARAKAQLPALFQQKKRRYQELESTATLDVPDPTLQTAWRWGHYSTDWLRRDVPGLGRGLSAGLPDYPWFFSNDQAYTFKALTGFVDPQLFYDSWHLLKKLSDKANQGSGRIIHEASTTGAVYDQGRMEESQLHLEAAWHIFTWTGNQEFLRENYAYAQKTLAWLLQHDQDHDLYVEGYGGVEIKGLNDEMLDVAVHTQQLLAVMAQMAAVLHQEPARATYQAQADTLRARINRDWWVPAENRYADFIAEPAKALAIIDTALVHRVHAGRNEWARQKLLGLRASIVARTYTAPGYVVYYNGSGLLPLTAGIADSAKARQALAHEGYFTNKFGVYISGIERPDNISQDEGSVLARKKGEFNYNQAVMPAATGSLALAECRYGSPDRALGYMHKILNSFGYATPGTTYEVSPDYGMFVQAWNVTGLYIPVVQYFFGIRPQAWQRQITIQPNFPGGWPYARLHNVLIGDTKLSVDYQKTGATTSYKIVSTAPGWTIHFVGPKAAQVSLNGQPVAAPTGRLTLKQGINELRFSK